MRRETVPGGRSVLRRALRRTPAPVQRALGSGLPIATGVLVGVTAFWHLVTPGEPLVSAVIAAVALAGLAVPLGLGGAWLARRDDPEGGAGAGDGEWGAGTAEGPLLAGYVAAWTLVGAVSVVSLASLAVFYEMAHGARLADPWLLVSWSAGPGGIGGFLTGVYDGRRAIRQAQYERVTGRLSTLVETVPVGLAVLEADGTVAAWNETAESLFGWSRAEVVGDTVPVVADEDYAAFEAAVGQVATGGAPVDGLELAGRRRDGTAVDVQCWAARLSDGRRSPAGSGNRESDRVILALDDITDRKRRERENELFAKAVHETGHAVMIADREGEIQYVNPAFEETTGYGAEEVHGETPSVLKSGKHSDAFYEDLWDTILSGQVWESELINQRKSGELYQVRQTIAPITGADGDITHFVGIESDITGQRLREQRLEVLNRILRHNIRNSVTVIRGHADLLRAELDEPHLRERADSVLERAESLETISEKAQAIRDVFQRDAAAASTVDVAALLESVVADLRDSYPHADIRLDAEGVSAVGTPESLRLAVFEAVDNAVVHSDKSTPTVRITAGRSATAADAEMVDIAIADDGPGIPETERATLELGEETPLVHGSGIGLWIINWTAVGFGGDLDISENDPEGSVVTLHLPAAETAPTDEAADEIAADDA